MGNDFITIGDVYTKLLQPINLTIRINPFVRKYDTAAYGKLTLSAIGTVSGGVSSYELVYQRLNGNYDVVVGWCEKFTSVEEAVAFYNTIARGAGEHDRY